MSIYKRGETYWLQFTDQDGKRIQQSAGTKNKQEAQELHDRLKAASWREKRLGARTSYTWQDAVIKWLTEQADKKSLATDKVHLRWLDAHLKNIALDQITKQRLDDIKTAKQATGVSNATVNRVMSIIRAILNRAKDEWEWLDTVPKTRALKEPSCRIRWLTHEQAELLLAELPTHLNAMARFALATGLREANVTKLEWSQIDLARECAWVHADQAKGKKSIAVPLSYEAIEVLQSVSGQHERYVFTFKGKPVLKAGGKAWRNALKRAGIEDFHWHDLRHTWASWHIQNGTPVTVLKELGGWSDLSIVMRYAHLSSEQLKNYAGNSLTKKAVTKILHLKKTA